MTAVDDVSFELRQGECLGIVESLALVKYDRKDDHASAEHYGRKCDSER